MAAAAIALVVTVGDGPRADRVPPALRPTAAGRIQIIPAIRLTQVRRWVSRALPSRTWELSLDLSLGPASRVQLVASALRAPAAGKAAHNLAVPAAHGLVFSRAAGGGQTLSAAGRTLQLPVRHAWGPAGVGRHVELAGGAHPRLTVNGASIPLPAGPLGSGPIVLQALRGRATVHALILSARSDRPSLLLHRLAELHARLVPGARLSGADRHDVLHFGSTWTSGFWPGALWQAAALQPVGDMFERWAMQATVKHFGLERSPTHDVGFMYGQSSLEAWRARCRGRAARPRICTRLAQSVLSAARELVALAATNSGAGTIPTNADSPAGQTIIDSMMNIGILTWAARYAHDRAFARRAAHQAQVIGSLLVRRDGSTIQAVHFDRETGRIVFLGTHQGLSDTSTWSRGQGWGLYGFAQTALDLHDRRLLAIAQRIAQYVAASLPPTGIPRWDYDAGPRGPLDVSAGVITAAGMFHLAEACRRLPGVCADPTQWVTLGRTMLAAALGRAASRPPIGFLGSQVLDGRRRHSWSNGSELIFGLSYALEALRLERTVR